MYHDMPFLEGRFAFTVQGEDFFLNQSYVDVIKIGVGEYIFKSEDGEDKMYTALVGDTFYAESVEKEKGFYSVVRLDAAFDHFTMTPVMFDRAQLDTKNIPYTIIKGEKPKEESKKLSFIQNILKQNNPGSDEADILIVDNSNVASGMLESTMAAGSVSFRFNKVK